MYIYISICQGPHIASVDAMALAGRGDHSLREIIIIIIIIIIRTTTDNTTTPTTTTTTTTTTTNTTTTTTTTTNNKHNTTQIQLPLTIFVMVAGAATIA